MTRPVSGAMRATVVGLPHVGEDLALHELELVERAKRDAGRRHLDAPPFGERRRIEKAQLSVPSLMIRLVPSWVSPQPSPWYLNDRRGANVVVSYTNATLDCQVS